VKGAPAAVHGVAPGAHGTARHGGEADLVRGGGRVPMDGGEGGVGGGEIRWARAWGVCLYLSRGISA